MRRGARAVAAAVVVVLLGLVATGCGVIEAAIETEEALQRAGFSDATVNYESDNGFETVTVEWTAQAETTEQLDEESLRVAGVIWREAPVYFDQVETLPAAGHVADFSQTRSTFSRQQLEQEYGPRPEGLDQDIGDLLNVRGLVTGAVLAFVVVSAIVVTIIVLVVRSGRKHKPAHAGYPAPAGYQGWPGYPPPGYPPPGWPPAGPPGVPPGVPPGPPPGAWPAGPTPDDPYRAPPG